ncbi:hypothetical protein BP6252_05029 [Coleophoma cylindrospora]|uniref:Uncharacterized protein n=1 Tax=Coleophoma cylindrospora TaxID=1849047 RepID=A0A3D8RSP7_9HELO|nr:hypothetical protein BP6252_05029 [Coleophoma cylindrospora]
MAGINIAISQHVLEPYLDCSVQYAILNTIFNKAFVPMDLPEDSKLEPSYIQYYRNQCTAAFTRHKNSLTLIITTHEDILAIIEQLKDLRLTREQIKDHLRSRIAIQPEYREKLICEAIDLGVRLWLMIDVGEIIQTLVPGQRPIKWEQGYLQPLLHATFTPSIEIHERVKLDRIFTIYNLERIAGLHIFWTSNLADHLRLISDNTKVAIFHHASFLEHHRTNNMFPPGFVEETLRTLALLLPSHNKISRKWFQIQQRKFILDSSAADHGDLSTEERQIDNFVFWHDRLVILKQVFDEAEPSTIRQWWCDRRRRVQWYTFWVAATVLALTIFFGVIQSIEGGLQAYKAFNPT